MGGGGGRNQTLLEWKNVGVVLLLVMGSLIHTTQLQSGRASRLVTCSLGLTWKHCLPGVPSWRLGWQGMRRNRCSLRVTLRHQTQFLCGKGPSHLPWACSALAWIQPCRFSLVAAKSCSAQALGDAPCLPCSTLLP